MTLGEIAYEAYRSFSDGKSLASGYPIPPWADLPVKIQFAWGVSADAVRDQLSKD